MKLISLLTIILTLSFANNGQTKGTIKETSTTEKWQRLMKLIDKEIKSIHHVKKKGPRLQYRLFELYSEKIKLIKKLKIRIL